MTKVPFDIKYRPQIESGEYKVETNFGSPVEIVCWNRRDDTANKTIVGIIRSGTVEEIASWNIGGKLCDAAFPQNSDYDLFIVTPEEELTDWGKAVGIVLTDYQLLPRDKDGIANIHDINEFTKKKAAELLSLAREQFTKDGYVIEKKAFHDAVEKVDPGIMKEVSKNVDMTEYEKGRADALNDLPRWKKICRGNNYSSETKFAINGRYLEMNDTLNDVYEVSLSELEKLPKED